MTSKVEICNLALRHLGNSNEIGNIDTDQTEQAAACRAFYNDARDAVLRDFPWPFATKNTALTGRVLNPTDEWAYSYVYPSDCIRAHRIVSGVRPETQAARIRFRVVNGTLIYADDDSPVLEYTCREEDPGLYPTDFVLAFSLRLASYIAPSITGGDPFKLGERAFARYLFEIAQAQASAANEEMPDQLPDASWISER